MKKVIIILILLLFTVTCDRQVKDNFYENGVEYITINNLPIVEALVNEKTCYFILDSGASTSVFNLTDVTKYGGRVVELEGSSIQGLGGTSALKGAGGLLLEVGGVKLAASFAAQDLSNVLRAIGKPGLVGVIGSDVFKRYGFILDYSTQTIYLSDFNTVVPNEPVTLN